LTLFVVLGLGLEPGLNKTKKKKKKNKR
jgi:hypothetical protein